jgi:Tfp pilus assembly protein PilE
VILPILSLVLLRGTTTINSDEGHYTIALTLTGGGTGWSMTATAVGDQAADSDCVTMTLNSLGTKTATKQGGAASTVCW